MGYSLSYLNLLAEITQGRKLRLAAADLYFLSLSLFSYQSPAKSNFVQKDAPDGPVRRKKKENTTRND